MTPELAALFATQAGRVHRSQALERGETRASIRRRVVLGDWIERPGDVLAIAGVPPSFATRCWDALLALPPGKARLFRSTAAYAHGMRHTREPGVLDIGVKVTTTRDELPDVRITRLRDWTRRSEQRAAGLPATSRAETIADCAAVLGLPSVLALLQDEVFNGRITLADVCTRFGRGRAGSTVLREAVGHLQAGRESVLTVIVFDIALSAGFPEPECGVVVIDGYGPVDLFWREARLVVEPKGYNPHGDHESWYGDAAKRDALKDAGLEVLEPTWRQATRLQGELANRISRPLAAANLIPAPLALPSTAVLAPRWAQRRVA